MPKQRTSPSPSTPAKPPSSPPEAFSGEDLRHPSGKDLESIVGPARAPYEQLPKEPDEHYSRFLEFCESPLTLKKLVRTEGWPWTLGSTNTISKRYNWVARKSAYRLDSSRNRLQRSEVRVLETSEALNRTWREILDWALESMAHQRSQGVMLSPQQVIDAVKEVTAALQLLEGKPTERNEVQVTDFTAQKLEEIVLTADPKYALKK